MLPPTACSVHVVTPCHHRHVKRNASFTIGEDDLNVGYHGVHAYEMVKSGALSLRYCKSYFTFSME